MARTIAVALWLSALSVVAPAAAQETKQLEPVVVSATKLETPASQVGAAVTVITAEDFKTYHYEIGRAHV